MRTRGMGIVCLTIWQLLPLTGAMRTPDVLTHRRFVVLLLPLKGAMRTLDEALDVEAGALLLPLKGAMRTRSTSTTRRTRPRVATPQRGDEDPMVKVQVREGAAGVVGGVVFSGPPVVLGTSACR